MRPQSFASLVTSLVVFVVGYLIGYDVGREDMALAKDRARILAEAKNLLVRNADAERWAEWDTALQQVNALIEQTNSLVDAWNGQDIAQLDEIINKQSQIVEILKASEVPPDIEWYWEGLLRYHQDLLEVDQLVRKSLTAKDPAEAARLREEAIRLEKQANERFVNITERYERWLEETGQN